MITTADDVWKILAELAESQKETERRFRETDHRFQETDHRFQETERMIKEQNPQLNEQLGKLGNRLGEFVEWQVRPAVVRLFQERGIDVHEFHSSVAVKRADGRLEIDLLVVNTTEAILIEVKSKLTQRDVDDHVQRLGKFKQFMPRYQDVNALGAVAGMVVTDEVANYAHRQGLFVLAQSGDSVVILNDHAFQPKSW
ncbi:MAG: DUF3782 domain-containing protein [Synechocystis sp.]